MNSIKMYMNKITTKAGFKTKQLSNISARKHLVGQCRKAGVPDGTTMKVASVG